MQPKASHFESNFSKIIILSILIIPVVINPLGYEIYTIPAVALLYAAVALMLFFTHKNIFDNPLALPLISIVIAAFISTVAAVDKSVAFFGGYGRYEGLVTILGYILLVFFLVNISLPIYKKENKISISELLIYFSMPITIYGILQAVGIDFLPYGKTFGDVRVFSTFGNPMDYAAYLVLLTPLALALALSRKRAVFGIAFVLMVINLLLTSSRAGWLGGALSIVLFGYLLRNGMTTKFKLIIIIVLVSVFLALKVPYIYNRVASFDLTDSSLRNRVMTWDASAGMVAGRPLTGYGADNFRFVFPKYKPADWFKFSSATISDRPHNFFLDILTSFGLLGFVSLLWPAVWFLHALVRFFGKESGSEDKTLITGIAAGIGGYLLNIQFGFTNIQSITVLILMFAAAIKIMNPFPAKIPEKSKQRHYKAMAIMLSTVFAILGAGHFLSDAYMSAGARNSNIESRNAYYQTAIDIFPKYQFMIDKGNTELDAAKKNMDKNMALSAAGTFNKAAAAHPSFQDAYFHLGQSYLTASGLTDNRQEQNNFTSMAERNYKAALKIDPVWGEALTGLAIAYANNGQFKQAIEAANKAIEYQPSMENAYLVLGTVLENTGDVKTALQVYQQALKISADFQPVKERYNYLTGGK